MKRFLIAAMAGFAALAMATGCGQRDVDPQSGTGSGVTLTSAPIDAALVTPQFGWVLTADALLLTEDGGTTFRPAEVDLPAGVSRAASFRGTGQGWVAAADGPGIKVARVGADGRSVGLTTIPTMAPVAELSIAFGDAERGALLAKTPTSGAFSRAELYVTADGGATWKAGTAPVAGRLKVEAAGRIWLAGGVLGNELYLSRDHGTTWTRPQLVLTGAGAVEAVAAPLSRVVMVTVSNTGRSRVALLTTTDDGDSWRESISLALSTDTAAAPAFSPVIDSSVIVADPAGARLGRATIASPGSSTVSTTQANGLPAGVSHLTFASPTAGWALASAGHCSTGKQNCAITHSLVTTADSGRTWHQALQWADKIG